MELGSVTNTIVSFESEMRRFFFFQICLQNCSSLSMLKKMMWEEGERGITGYLFWSLSMAHMSIAQ